LCHTNSEFQRKNSVQFNNFIIKKVGLEGLENYMTLVSRPRPRPDHSVKTKTETFFQVLEVPRDQDHVLEDYSTAVDWLSKQVLGYELLAISGLAAKEIGHLSKNTSNTSAIYNEERQRFLNPQYHEHSLANSCPLGGGCYIYGIFV
jgi:hypothetical protein